MSEYASLTARLLDLAQTKGALQERTRIMKIMRKELRSIQKTVSDLKSQQSDPRYINGYKAKAVELRNIMILIQPEES